MDLSNEAVTISGSQGYINSGTARDMLTTLTSIAELCRTVADLSVPASGDAGPAAYARALADQACLDFTKALATRPLTSPAAQALYASSVASARRAAQADVTWTSLVKSVESVAQGLSLDASLPELDAATAGLDVAAAECSRAQDGLS